jgi:general secretion pathway protein K
VSFQVLAANRGEIALMSARVQQARLAAAADAGISLAIHGLAAEDRGVRWSIDGRSRRLEFNGVDLTVTVEDERSKAPLAIMSDAQSRALFAGAGATGDRLDALVAEFREWQSDPAAGVDMSGLKLPPSDGRPVRHGPFRTVGELAALQDMTPAIFARIEPVVTVFSEDSGPFEASHADPLAVAAMNGDTLESPDQIDEQAQAANQKADADLADDESLVGRTLTIRAVAQGRDGARAHKMEIVELTGDSARPYWVRYAE